MKLTTLPPFPQPKHLKMPLAGETVNDGVFSLWKGHNPSMLTPLRLRVTNSEITSVISATSSIRSMVAWSIIGTKIEKRMEGKGTGKIKDKRNNPLWKKENGYTITIY
jgi:hypothetical protein